jgi:hypothetical protein
MINNRLFIGEFITPFAIGVYVESYINSLSIKKFDNLFSIGFSVFV